MTYRSEAFTRAEAAELPYATRIIATVERGFAPDRSELNEWAERAFGLRSATESLDAALEIAAEYDVTVTVTADSGRATVTVDTTDGPHDVFDGDRWDAAAALVAWLHNHDKEAA